MKPPSDPPRLGSPGSEAPARLRAGIEARRREKPSPERLAAIAQGLGPLFDVPPPDGGPPAPPPAPPAAPPPVASGALASAKLKALSLAAAALLGGAGVSTWLLNEPARGPGLTPAASALAPLSTSAPARVDGRAPPEAAATASDRPAFAAGPSAPPEGGPSRAETPPAVAAPAHADAPSVSAPVAQAEAAAPPAAAGQADAPVPPDAPPRFDLASPSVAPPAPRASLTQPPPRPTAVAPAGVKPAAAAPPPPAPGGGLAPAPPRPPAGTTPPATAQPAGEARLLMQARQALAASPAEALAHCTEHQRHYARGALTQEREVIVIEALARLGRRDEAAERLKRFAQAHPRSAYRPRLEALVGN